MSRIKFPLLVILLVAGIFTGVVGIGSSMSTEQDGSMSCPFRGNVCQMTITEHLAQWHGLLQATVKPPLAILLHLIWVSVVLFVVLPKLDFTPSISYVWAKGRDSTLKLFDYLLQAFSRGILHSQIYA